QGDSTRNLRVFLSNYVLLFSLFATTIAVGFIFVRRGRAGSIKPAERSESLRLEPQAIQAIQRGKDLFEHGPFSEAVIYDRDALRQRLNEKFKFRPTFTTEEIIEKLRAANLELDINELTSILTFGDRCKFGQYQPTEKEARDLVERASKYLERLHRT